MTSTLAGLPSRTTSALAVLSLSLALGACGGGDDAPAPAPAPADPNTVATANGLVKGAERTGMRSFLPRHGTSRMPTHVSGAETTVYAGAGNDTFNVGTSAPAAGGDLDRIGALLTIYGEEGLDTLNTDDSGDESANSGTLSDTTITSKGRPDSRARK